MTKVLFTHEDGTEVCFKHYSSSITGLWKDCEENFWPKKDKDFILSQKFTLSIKGKTCTYCIVNGVPANCGLLLVSHIFFDHENFKKYIVPAVIHFAKKENYTRLLYTGHKETQNKIEKAGFKLQGEFVNRRTQNTLVQMYLDVWE